MRRQSWQRSVHCLNPECAKQHRIVMNERKREQDRIRRLEQDTYQPVKSQVDQERKHSKVAQDIFLGTIPESLHADQCIPVRRVVLDGVSTATWLQSHK